jgi:hypothetical protein
MLRTATKKYVDDNMFADRLIGTYEQSVFIPSGGTTEYIGVPPIRLISAAGKTIKIIFAIISFSGNIRRVD